MSFPKQDLLSLWPSCQLHSLPPPGTHLILRMTRECVVPGRWAVFSGCGKPKADPRFCWWLLLEFLSDPRRSWSIFWKCHAGTVWGPNVRSNLFMTKKAVSPRVKRAASHLAPSFHPPAMKTTFLYNGRAETSRRSMLMYGRHANMWHSPLLSLVKHENIADLCPSLQHCSLWVEP